MKKSVQTLRFTVLAVVLIAAAASILSACSADDAEATGAAQDYLSWTKSDWDSADETQKTEAAKVVVTDLEEGLLAAFGGEEAASASAGDGELLNETAQQMIEDIDVYFEGNPDGTLQDLVDDTMNLLGLN